IHDSVRRDQGIRTAALFLALLAGAAAHDIPSDATARVFLKPTGQRLNLLVRVPLKAIRDVDFREREHGYLDLEYVDPLLPDAAMLWIGNFAELYEGETRLPKPRVVATRLSLESDKSFASYERALA